MNEQILDTLANVGVTLAAFSGLVGAFRARGSDRWSTTEFRVLWFLILDGFLVVFFAVIPIPLTLAQLSSDMVWGICSALLGTWFLIGAILAWIGERRDRLAGRSVKVPIITPILYGVIALTPLMGVVLLLSVWDIIPRGQAVYVFGLVALLVVAAVEFLFFIGLAAFGTKDGAAATDKA